MISDYSNVENNCDKMSELTGLKITDLKRAGDKNSVIQYFLDGPVSLSEKLEQKGVYALDSVYSLQRLVNHIEKHSNIATNYVQPELKDLKEWDSGGQILREIGPMPVFPDMISDIKSKCVYETIVDVNLSGSNLKKNLIPELPAFEPEQTKPKSGRIPEKKLPVGQSNNQFARMFDGHIL